MLSRPNPTDNCYENQCIVICPVNSVTTRASSWSRGGGGGGGTSFTGKNNGFCRFPFLDILGYLKNTDKNPKFGKVRQVPTWEFPTKFPDWDLSHSSKFGIFLGIP